MSENDDLDPYAWNEKTDAAYDKGRGSRRSSKRPAWQQTPRRQWTPPKRPEEVSTTVYGLAEQWLEEVSQTLEYRPMVNLGEFSKRLNQRIRHDPEVIKFLRPREFNRETKRVQDVPLSDEEKDLRHDEVVVVVATMIRLFCRDLIVGSYLSPSEIQHQFLDDFEDLLER